MHIKNVGWVQRRCIWLAVNAPIKTALLSVRALGSESGRRDAAAASPTRKNGFGPDQGQAPGHVCRKTHQATGFFYCGFSIVPAKFSRPRLSAYCFLGKSEEMSDRLCRKRGVKKMSCNCSRSVLGGTSRSRINVTASSSFASPSLRPDYFGVPGLHLVIIHHAWRCMHAVQVQIHGMADWPWSLDT